MYTWGIGADGSTYDTWTQDYTIEAPAGGSDKDLDTGYRPTTTVTYWQSVH